MSILSMVNNTFFLTRCTRTLKALSTSWAQNPKTSRWLALSPAKCWEWA